MTSGGSLFCVQWVILYVHKNENTERVGKKKNENTKDLERLLKGPRVTAELKVSTQSAWLLRES